jgi:hypothetical protein
MKKKPITKIFMNVVCLSCWDLPNQGASCNALGTSGNSLMTKGAWNLFHNVLANDGEIIENWIFFHQTL